MLVVNKDSLMRGRMCGKLHGGQSQLLFAVIDPIARYSSKSAIFAYLPAFDVRFTGFPSE